VAVSAQDERRRAVARTLGDERVARRVHAARVDVLQEVAHVGRGRSVAHVYVVGEHRSTGVRRIQSRCASSIWSSAYASDAPIASRGTVSVKRHADQA